MKHPGLHILIVEADPAKEYLLENSIASCGTASSVRRVQRVDQAIAYLSGSTHYSNRRAHPFPTVMLVDLVLPDGPGTEVLHWLRTQGKAIDTAVLILCASREDDGLKRAAELGAHSYLVKPITPDGLCERIQSVSPPWSDPGKHPG